MGYDKTKPLNPEAAKEGNGSAGEEKDVEGAAEVPATAGPSSST